MKSAAALPKQVMALERPDPALFKYYAITALLTGPGLIAAFPYYYFRYHTLRYRFDEEGIHMRVGFLFRREINLTYARIQDIHLRSGFIQRWLGLANVEVQTASGSSSAELVIEGFKEYEIIRDFLYSRMRGVRDHSREAGAALETPGPASGARAAGDAGISPAGDAELVPLLSAIRDELRSIRELLQKKP